MDCGDDGDVGFLISPLGKALRLRARCEYLATLKKITRLLVLKEFDKLNISKKNQHIRFWGMTIDKIYISIKFMLLS